MNKTRSFLAGFVVVLIVCGVLFVGLLGTTNAMNSYSTQLESVYKTSFYELANGIGNIESKLAKTVLSTNGEQQKELLEDISKTCSISVSNLNKLPVEHSTLKETTRFLNQMSGYSYILLNKLPQQSLDNEQISKLDELHTTSIKIKNLIDDFVNNNNNINIIKTSKITTKNRTLNTLFTNFKSNDEDYPSMIYDGPFSDSTTNMNVKGLEFEIVSKDSAFEQIKSIFENATEYQQVGENAGNIATYNFSLTTDTGRKGFAQITKNGGKLLSFNCYSKQVADKLTDSECEERAEAFAQKVGLSSMKAVWSAKLNGVSYVNLTPIIDGVIVYPDMVKVKVNCNNGEILGWDAKAYYLNHITRDNLVAKINQVTAKNAVNKKFEIQSTKLCLIPLEYNREELAYEYHCLLGEQEYYVYISATTGEQINMLKVVNRIDGKRMI